AAGILPNRGLIMCRQRSRFVACESLSMRGDLPPDLERSAGGSARRRLTRRAGLRHRLQLAAHANHCRVWAAWHRFRLLRPGCGAPLDEIGGLQRLSQGLAEDFALGWLVRAKVGGSSFRLTRVRSAGASAPTACSVMSCRW